MACVRRNNGSWMVMWYAGSSDDRRTKTFKSRGDADRFRIEIEKEFPQGGAPRKKKVKRITKSKPLWKDPRRIL